MQSIEAEGNSIDEAIANALETLGTARERVEIEILSNAARGLFGIGGRKARVRATVRAPLRLDTDPLPVDPTAPVSGGTAANAPEHRREDCPQAVGHAMHFLEELMRLMEIPGAVSVEAQDDAWLLDLRGDTSGILIGRRGQMLDALEYLANRLVAQESGVRVVVDSQNYRTRRREALEALARRLGEQAKKKNKAVSLNPMPPRDRRIVHMVLQGDPAIRTRSSGTGYFRRLVITPAGGSKPSRSDA